MKKCFYFIEVCGSKATVRALRESDILIDYSVSSGLGGGAGAGQLCGICSEPWKPLEKAITTDKSPLGTVYRFAAGHGSLNIIPLETEETLAAARKIVRAGKNKKRRRR